MKIAIWLLFCCFSIGVFGQQDYKLNVSFTDGAKALAKAVVLPKNSKDSLQVYKEANRLLSQLQFKGYLLAEITSLAFEGKEATVTIQLNQLYQWVKLSSGNLSSAVKQSIGFKERNYERVDFNAERLTNLFETLLSYYENNGYPFASVSLQQIGIEGNAINASINVQLHQKVLFDTLQIVGNAQISQRYLQSYLNAKSGMPYTEKSIVQLENRLRELPFLAVVKPAEVNFSNEKATVRVFVNKKNANQFDGVIGLQQNGNNTKAALVGNLKLHLQNAFKTGEQLHFNYQGLGQQSQLLAISTSFAHVHNTDFGLSPSLYLYKQDSTFLNVDIKLGFNYLLKGNNNFQFFVENKSTSLSAVDAYVNATILPSILDASTTFYGLGLTLENLDYRYNPQKGYSITFDAAVGGKKIRRNAAIPQNLYNAIPLQSTS